MAGGAAYSGSVVELLLGVGSTRLAQVAASSLVGARCLASLASSTAEVWHHLEVMVVMGVTCGGAWLVLQERGGLGGAGAGSGRSAPGLRWSWHGSGCCRLAGESA
jgi:hypothetical protein